MLHQNNIAIKTPLRCVLFASWRLPIISDYCKSPEPYELFFEPLLHFDFHNSKLRNESMVNRAVDANYKLVTEIFPFKKCVEEAVH